MKKIDHRIDAQYEKIKRAEPRADPQRAYHRHRQLIEVVTRETKPGDLLDIGAGWAVESRVLGEIGHSITVMDFARANSGFLGRFDQEEFKSGRREH